MAKRKVSKELSELKKELEDGKVILGMESVTKNLKKGNLSKVYLASNCPEKFKDDINYYSELAKVPITVLEIDNEGIGVICKKHFFVSVLGVKR
ncbi:MAG: ribosomal L7Ae/L30e/S12e/Gadd45 family protein [Candidatus Woesearchaeota archaeon]